ncbi:MAG: ribonuclease Y [bacterium]|nr:ribonuclease Y [bacterium]
MSVNIGYLFAIVVGIFLGIVIRVYYAKLKADSIESTAKKVLDSASQDAEAHRKEILLEAKEDVLRMKKEAEVDAKDRRSELKEYEKTFVLREKDIARKQDTLEEEYTNLKKDTALFKQTESELAEEKKTIVFEKGLLRKEMEKVAGMSQEEAKEVLIKELEDDAQQSAFSRLKKIEEELYENADKKAKNIISQAIQRMASDHTAEITVSSVSIPNDDMKGRIIGREGRNIRAFEAATGVDVIVDDTPETITLSSFDGVRREIARVSLERLMLDGRIHPARIEEMVAKVKGEMNEHIKDVGEQAAAEVGVPGLPTEIIKLIGRLKYRTSYGQNVLKHSIEVAHFAKLIAAEMGLDTDLCLRAGFLHDIGKAVDHEVEGTHARIGADILKKHYPNSPRLINAVVAHHECSIKPETPEAIIIASSDAISAARPGARRESYEFYIKRMSQLEEIANNFQGVEDSFAVQAGREVRVIVEPKKIKDEEMCMLSKEVAAKIESELDYPGQIKVMVIRETRSTEVAK